MRRWGQAVPQPEAEAQALEGSGLTGNTGIGTATATGTAPGTGSGYRGSPGTLAAQAAASKAAAFGCRLEF